MSSSRKSIFVAIAANVAIAAAKFAGFAFTGSASMLSEGIHSLVDCGNGGLLLLGLSRSQKPANELHPFGYGKELYFWSLIVAVLIFVLGGGISIAEGIDHVRHPSTQKNILWAYGILSVAAVFEAYALFVSVREFRAAHPSQRLVAAIRASKDPSSFTVIFEDTAALLGLVFAFLGLAVSQLLGIPRADGVASVLIGVLLLCVSVLLIIECKALLIGEGADRETLRVIRSLAEAEPHIVACGYPLTMYFGPQTALLVWNVQLRSGLGGDEILSVLSRLENAIQARFPEIKQVSLELTGNASLLTALPDQTSTGV